MNPLVSVVIPVYNSEETIQSTLDSVLKQTYKNFEIIIVNDGSKDASKKIVLRYINLNTTQRIRYYFQENQGVSSARNLGLRKAAGDYMALLDSDDLWDKDKLRLQMEILNRNPDIDLLATNKDDAKFKKNFVVEIKELMPVTSKLMLYKNFILTSTVVFKKEILGTVGYFNEDMAYCEDMEYFIRVADKFNCYLYNVSLVNAWQGKPAFGHSGLSANLWKMEKGELKAIKKAYSLKTIIFFEYLIFNFWSFLKFIRRLLISKLRFQAKF